VQEPVPEPKAERVRVLEVVPLVWLAGNKAPELALVDSKVPEPALAGSKAPVPGLADCKAPVPELGPLVWLADSKAPVPEPVLEPVRNLAAVARTAPEAAVRTVRLEAVRIREPVPQQAQVRC
jgi:hypothetical protein